MGDSAHRRLPDGCARRIAPMVLTTHLSMAVLLPADPLADVGRAMEDGNAGGLTAAEEAHYLYIHQRHLVQVQHCPGSVALQLYLQGLQMLRLQVADQPERRVVPVSMPFNLAGPLRCLFPVLCAVCDR